MWALQPGVARAYITGSSALRLWGVPRTWRLFGEVHAFLFQGRMLIAVCLAVHLGVPGCVANAYIAGPFALGLWGCIHLIYHV